MKNDNVIHLVDKSGDTPIDGVLEEMKGILTDGIVIGWDKDDEFHFSMSLEKKCDVLFLLKLMEHRLMNDD